MSISSASPRIDLRSHAAARVESVADDGTLQLPALLNDADGGLVLTGQRSTPFGLNE